MGKTKTAGIKKAPAKKKTPAKGGRHGKIAPGAKDSILTVMAEFEAIGMMTPTRSLVAHMSGYTGGAEQAGFKKALSGLSNKGYLTYPSSSTLGLTEDGKVQVSDTLDPPTTNGDIHERIKKMLSSDNAKKIFDLLTDGKVHTRKEVARVLDYPNETVRHSKRKTATIFISYPF